MDSNTAWSWNRGDKPSWFLSEEAEEQEDSRNFSFGATANTTGKARSFTLIFKAGTLERRVEITQEGSLSVSDTVQTNTAVEQTRDFQVFAAADSSWVWNSSDPGWLNGDGEALTQTGSNTFIYRVKANDSNLQRSGTLTFTSKVGTETATVVINQLPGGEPGGRFLILTDSQQATDFNAKDTLQVTLETNTQWTWESNESWLSSTELTTQDGDNKIFVYQVAENSSGATRTGQLTFRSTSGGIVQTLEVTQTGNAVDEQFLSLSASTVALGQEEGSRSITISSNTVWSWMSSTDGTADNWLTSAEQPTQDFGPNNLISPEFKYNVTENTTGEDRTGTLSFTYLNESSVEVTTTLVVTQEGSLALSDTVQTVTSAQQIRTIEVFAAEKLSWVWASSDPSWLNSVGEALGADG